MIITIYPYLVMDGNGQDAVDFYKNALEAKVTHLQTFGDIALQSDPPMPEDLKKRVLNAELLVGNTKLMISDTFPGPHQEQYQLGSQVEIALIVDQKEKAHEVFAKLIEGGTEIMPLQETFWSPCYGQVEDKFGVKWQISAAGGNQG